MKPIAGVIGAAIVIIVQPLLPYALGFTAGAMVGFALMMVLDVTFG